MAGKPRRILMLHGYTQNAVILSKRMGAIRKACAKDVEFVFVDAPIKLEPADNQQIFDGTAASPTLEGDPRAWWRVNPERTDSRGMEESCLFLRDVLKGSHFDGVFGFSQGAAMAVVLSALLERPHVFPAFLVDGQPPHPPFKWCVSVSGFRPRGKIADLVFDPNYSTPTLHIIGKNDVVVIEERSRKLISISTNARLEEHDGGHFIPSKANWRAFFQKFFTSDNPIEEALLIAPTPLNEAAANEQSLADSGVSAPLRGQL